MDEKDIRPDDGSTPVPDMPKLSPEEAAELERLARGALKDAGVVVGKPGPDEPISPFPPKEDLQAMERVAREAIREAGINVAGPGEGPEARTWEQIRGEFAPDAPAQIEIRGWENLMSKLEDINTGVGAIAQARMTER